MLTPKEPRMYNLIGAEIQNVPTGNSAYELEVIPYEISQIKDNDGILKHYIQLNSHLEWSSYNAPAPGSVIQSWLSAKIAAAPNTYLNCICHKIIGEADVFCGESLSTEDISVTLKDSTVMSAYDEDGRSWALSCQNQVYEYNPYDAPWEPYVDSD